LLGKTEKIHKYTSKQKIHKYTSKQSICGQIMNPDLPITKAEWLANLSWRSRSTVFVVSFFLCGWLSSHPQSEIVALIPGGIVCRAALEKTLRLADILVPAVPTNYLQRSNTMEQSFQRS
jgi:hypothetical protein